MNDDEIEQQLEAAEADLSKTLQRLAVLRRAALVGTYDARALNQAVSAFHVAEVRVLAARKACAEQRNASQAAAPREEEIVPLEPTPRLHFARWLIQHGRLSDWDLTPVASLIAAGPPVTEVQ